MNRMDRLLAIVLEMQAKKQVRAEDLAAAFETSKRTIYRDITALSESGVPIVAVPGQGYSLMDGYFLAPLTFTSDEAMMLLLGTGAAAPHFDEQYRSAAQSARQKIAAVLPEALRHEVDALESRIQFMVFTPPMAQEVLPQLRRAIIQSKTVQFLYRSRYTGAGEHPHEMRLRKADPYALTHIGGGWMLTAYCHLRQAVRHFRLSRMEDTTILSESFTRPADFKMTMGAEETRAVTVRLLFDHEVAPRVRESPSLYQVEEDDQAEGLSVTLRVRQIEDVMSWLLSWGAHVRVLEPDALRSALAREAEAMLTQYLIQNS